MTKVPKNISNQIISFQKYFKERTFTSFPNTKMVSSIRFDSIANEFGDLVTEVFAGTNEDQKTKLREMFDHFTKISNCPRKRKRKLVDNKLPPEMVEKILKFLNYKDICQAKLICKRWKEIIDNGNLVIKASSKTIKICSFCKYGI